MYDARTSGGGSGGPVLDRQGQVIGVNAAYNPDFEGGNYGVPIAIGIRLLAGGGQPATGATREMPLPLSDDLVPAAGATPTKSPQGASRRNRR